MWHAMFVLLHLAGLLFSWLILLVSLPMHAIYAAVDTSRQNAEVARKNSARQLRISQIGAEAEAEEHLRRLDKEQKEENALFWRRLIVAIGVLAFVGWLMARN